MTYQKPLPAPDPESKTFWAGCARHELLLPQCGSCGTFRFPPTSYCPHCRSKAANWRRSEGKGKLFSWIVVRHPVPRDVYADDVPYAVALVELEEGVRMVANIRGCDPDAIEAGMPLQIDFVDVEEGVALPVFRPAPSDERS